MRALSMCQPDASLLIMGRKFLETRSWQTNHRGPLLIHAARSLPEHVREECLREPLRSRLREAGIRHPDELPLGQVIGVAELVECVLAEEMDDIPETERVRGLFGVGQWVWRFEDATPFEEPIPARGRLGVFELKLETASLVRQSA